MTTKKDFLEEKIKNTEKVMNRAIKIELILCMLGLICLFLSIWVQQYLYQLFISGIFFWVVMIPFHLAIHDLREELYILKEGEKE